MTVPAAIATSPSSITRIAGTNESSLLCRVTGIPLPTITWFKDGMNISSDGRVIISITSFQFPENEPRFGFVISRVLIFNLQLSDDADYVCQAENIGAPGTTFLVKTAAAHITVQREFTYKHFLDLKVTNYSPMNIFV